MLSHLTIRQFHQLVHSSVILVHMNVFIPFDTHYQFILIYLRHPFLFHKIEEEHTDWQSGQSTQQTNLFMRKYPIDTFIIKTLQPFIFQQIIKSLGQEALAPYACSVK